MNKPEHHKIMIKASLTLPWWLTENIPPLNDNFSQRVVSLPQFAQWRPTLIDGVELRVLEHVPGAPPRLTGQIRLTGSYTTAELTDSPDLEILVQRGELESPMGVYPAGLYLRLPSSDDELLQSLKFRGVTTETQLEPPADHLAGHSIHHHKGHKSALLYIAAGQMLTSDTEQRRINTGDENRWLPGPVNGIDVLPLHGHGTGNAMLLRWKENVAFKPGLDPMGEEILVLQGRLNDKHGQYPAGSWIRNPIAAWQSWGAVSDTLIYYKNGHFKDTYVAP